MASVVGQNPLFRDPNYNLSLKPKIDKSAFIAPNSSIIGNVDIREFSSVWYNCVLRGDNNYIKIGERTNVQDGTIIHIDSNKYPTHIENDVIQYTHYNKGDYYNWHTDQDIRVIEKPNELVRKLSFTLQLSDENEYTGGNLEFADFDNSKNKFIAPRTRGCLIIFDSRVPHRVCPVKSGLRKSLVGWVMGKRWR